MSLKDITKETYDDYINYLRSMREDDYKMFQSKLISTKYEILGIRLPKLRVIAKEILKGNYQNFLSLSEAKYYEEVMIKLLVIAGIKKLDELKLYFDEAIDLIDDWALCDTFGNTLKVVAKNKKVFLRKIDALIQSDKTYYIRVGLILLLNYYIEEEYLDLIIKYLDNIKSDEYYVNMAQAWLVCEIFIKFQKVGLKYLADNKLNKFTINKSISKIRDSYRVSKEMKDYILQFKK